jgi:WD40 repeat protein
MFGLKRTANRVKSVWSGSLPDHVLDLAWSHDGHFLAAATSTGPITIFDAKAGTGDVALAGHSKGNLTLAWSPTANTLATAGKDRRVSLWDASGRPAACLEAAANWVERLAWHSDGSLLAATAGRTLQLWNANGEHITDLADHPSTISDLAWRPNTQTVCALVYGGVMLWTLHGQETPRFRLFPWKGSPLKMAWSPNGVMLAHGNQDSTVHFWYADTAEELQMSGYRTKVRELSWDSTSRHLATGGGPVVCIWDCSGTGPAGSKPQMLEGHEESAMLTAVQFQRRGHLLASAGTDGRLRIWQPRNKTPLVGGIDADGEITCLAWSPDEKLLAVGHETGRIEIVRVA